MKFKAKVEVKLKPGVFDPEGESAKSALRDLGFPVIKVSVNKVYEILLDASTEEDAKMLAKEMCEKLLANPVKDVYSIEVFKD